jgi:hypothetical protein
MIAKTKRSSKNGISRMLSGGDIKEIIIKEDILDPNKTSIEICFKGIISSGIVEITSKELETINKEVGSKMNLVKSSKVMRFKK